MRRAGRKKLVSSAQPTEYVILSTAIGCDRVLDLVVGRQLPGADFIKIWPRQSGRFIRGDRGG